MASQRKVTISNNEELAKEIGIDEVVEVSRSIELDEPVIEESTSIEDLEDSQEIWDGGPNAGMIKEWKKIHGEVYVTSLSFDKHIVWRVLSRLEYKTLVKKMEQLVQAGQLSSAEANMWNEEAIAEICTLYPPYDKNNTAGIMAGVPSLISQEVLEASGFVALEVRQL